MRSRLTAALVVLIVALPAADLAADPYTAPANKVLWGGQGVLVRMKLLAEHGQVVYLRPLSETNNGRNPHSPYRVSGRSRGPPSQPPSSGVAAACPDRARRRGRRDRREAAPSGAAAAADRRAAAAAAEGGADVGALTFGNPEIEKSHPKHFRPGGAYVDWVGTAW